VDQVYLINAEERHALVIVAEDQLSLAIGKEGQNVRLAARLTGWRIDIKDPATYERDKEAIEEAAQAARASMLEDESEEGLAEVSDLSVEPGEYPVELADDDLP
jgi:N utilization substance protein A